LWSAWAVPAAGLDESDDFEQPTLDSAWATTEQFGSVSLSTEQHRSGVQSVKLSSTSCGQREIRLIRNLAGPTKGTASVWFYDTSPHQQTLYSHFILFSGGEAKAAVYVQDYDGSFYYAHGNGVG
jgi:hypothetical protein